jgi:hypothetical protein
VGCDGNILCEAEGHHLNQEYIKGSIAVPASASGKEAEVFVSCKLARGSLPLEEAAREQFDATANPCPSSRIRRCGSSSGRTASP